MPKFRSSAQAAAGQCDGGSTDREYGIQWHTMTWNDSSGRLDSLNKQHFVPKSTKTGAIAMSDPNAGSMAPSNPAGFPDKSTAGDKAGAAILTLLTAAIIIGGVVLLLT
ncbi:uncharacterized protein A1O5_05641 [Cladophialophora psammophila CBS 110553]|uniref:Uncharacterized protein n=1 Tax=Cladophialophora psammophila CBS 110553 TaxID=1182543 RepID=W9X139_9EURO|nr:uncharacterized protein A1O5_05641 [Cladophialophora psammophila CBS 110553]EXJ70651.1 hypothetical protein A1O5_05641 [Cladophialophora psammophila CBS 110553]